jgi:hypothetical protein
MVSWLFVRFMPLVTDLKPGGRVITGNGRMDIVARKGINTLVGVGAIQGVHALATRDRNQISLDKMGGMMIDVLAAEGGNHAFSSALPMTSVRDLSALDRQTGANMRRIRDEIENAPPSNNWWDGGFGGMQPAFAYANAGGRGSSALRGPNANDPFGRPSATGDFRRS